MAVPKRKTSKRRRDQRSANKGMQEKAFASCGNCQKPIMTHQACSGCGFYKGSKVLETKADRALKRAEKANEISSKIQKTAAKLEASAK